MNDEPKTSDQIGPAHRGGPAPLRDPVATATQRIQLIIEAAEKAAAGIIEDAEAQARLYLDETGRRADRLADERARVMSDITDSLIDRAEAVKRQSDDLVVALDQAKAKIDEMVRERPSSMPDPPPPRLRKAEEPGRATPHLTPVEPQGTTEAPPIPPEAEPRVIAHPSAPASAHSSITASSAGARLIATQMVVAGSSRIEIENRLRNEFGIQEAGPMLDAILGPEA